jgi:hypothetical protein
MLDQKPTVKTATTPHPDSICELEYCLRKGISPRTILKLRKQGKTPPHYTERRQIRYSLADIEAFDQQKSKTESQT